MPLAVTLVFVMTMTLRPGRGILGAVRRTAGDAVAVVGGVAGQCDNHEGEGDEGGREELQEGHVRNTTRRAPSIPVKSP